METTGGFCDSGCFYLLVLGGRRNKRTTSRKTTRASFCFQRPVAGSALLAVEDAVLACRVRPRSSGEAEAPQ